MAAVKVGRQISLAKVFNVMIFIFLLRFIILLLTIGLPQWQLSY